MNKNNSDIGWVTWLYKEVQGELWRVRGDAYVSKSGHVWKHRMPDGYEYFSLTYEDYHKWLLYTKTLTDFDKDLRDLLNE